MGVLFRTFLFSSAGSAGLVAYLATKNQIVSPLASSDPIWTSSVYAKYNPSSNPATQDVCIKRIPMNKIRPDLLEHPNKLALEYCRGVWSGFGRFQTRIVKLIRC